MTTLFFGFSLFVCTLITIHAITRPKTIYASIFFIFWMAFGFTTAVPKFEGYAVKYSYVNSDTEALILNVYETKESFLVLASFGYGAEPRLIKIEKTKENEEEMQRAEGRQNMVLRFGKKAAKGSGQDSSDGDPGFEVLSMEQTEGFRK